MWTALVPARGGSKGVRGKNLRSVHGRPLILHTLDLLTTIDKLKVVVSTDDPQIRSTVLSHYPDIEVWERPERLATDESTIDNVAYHYFVNGIDPLLIVQPTTFGLQRNQILDLMAWATKKPGIYVATQPESGIYWLDGEMIGARTNRQHYSSALQKEVGLRAYTAWTNGGVPRSFPLSKSIIEIDNLGDFTEAEKDRRNVAICFSAAEGEGWGHVHRALSLHEALQHHRLQVACTPQTTPVARKFVEDHLGTILSSSSFGTHRGGVWINDTLDTTEHHIGGLIASGWKVITLEDQGPGSRLAHVTINALYGDGDYNGVRYAILRPEFLDLPDYEVRDGRRVLVSFGGEDSGGLGLRVAETLKQIKVDAEYLTPPALSPTQVAVARQMQEADLLITSAGRTVYEAMAVGVPTIVLAANMREARHCHLGPDHGNLYLGLANNVLWDTTLPKAVASLLAAPALRKEMSARGRSMVDGKGTERTVRIVEDLL